MKFMLKMYRLFKPVAIYTSYLFTMLTLLYLTGHTVFPKVLVLKAGILWGFFLFPGKHSGSEGSAWERFSEQCTV